MDPDQEIPRSCALAGTVSRCHRALLPNKTAAATVPQDPGPTSRGRHIVQYPHCGSLNVIGPRHPTHSVALCWEVWL